MTMRCLQVSNCRYYKWLAGIYK